MPAGAPEAAFTASRAWRRHSPQSPTKAGLLGKVVGYGRKPWRLIPLGDMAVDEV